MVLIFVLKRNFSTFARLLKETAIAKIAQLVEHDLAKVGVAGSSPVFRSDKSHRDSYHGSLSFIADVAQG